MSTNCKHVKDTIIDNSNYFCKLCGVLLLDKVKIIKSVKCHYVPETPQLEIYKNMLKSSSNAIFRSVSASYLTKRKGAVKYIQSLCSKLKYRAQTFYLALFYIDLIFNNKPESIYQVDVELASVCCVILAAKFDENDPIVPEMSRIPNVGSEKGTYYHVDDLCETEVDCIKLLDFKMNYFTAFHFLETYLSLGVVTEDELNLLASQGGHDYLEMKDSRSYSYSTSSSSRSQLNQSNKRSSNPILDKLYDICYDILETTIDLNKSFDFSQTVQAVSAISLAREAMGLSMKWPDWCEKVYEVTFESTKEYYEALKAHYVKNNPHLARKLSATSSVSSASSVASATNTNATGKKHSSTALTKQTSFQPKSYNTIKDAKEERNIRYTKESKGKQQTSNTRTANNEKNRCRSKDVNNSTKKYSDKMLNEVDVDEGIGNVNNIGANMVYSSDIHDLLDRHDSNDQKFQSSKLIVKISEFLSDLNDKKKEVHQKSNGETIFTKIDKLNLDKKISASELTNMMQAKTSSKYSDLVKNKSDSLQYHYSNLDYKKPSHSDLSSNYISYQRDRGESDGLYTSSSSKRDIMNKMNMNFDFDLQKMRSDSSVTDSNSFLNKDNQEREIIRKKIDQAIMNKNKNLYDTSELDSRLSSRDSNNGYYNQRINNEKFTYQP